MGVLSVSENDILTNSGASKMIKYENIMRTGISCQKSL